MDRDFIKIEEFKEPTYGDRMDIRDFIDNVKAGCFTPDDGDTGEVIVDGWLTNLAVSRFGGWSDKKIEISLPELALIPGKVEVMWYNK